jgi:isocitrate dehydrogenase
MDLMRKKIAVAQGDGIGPEIMRATLDLLKSAKAPLEYHFVEVGEPVFLSGEETGIGEKTWETIRETDAFLKGPITTPQGGGFKSLNVAIRTTLGLFANVRPCCSYYPFIETKHQKQDVVIIRENEEDLYMGIEYRQTQETFQALKVLTKKGCERIIRFAFQYAEANGRKKVSCFTKDNILKISDGLFHKTFQEIGKEYPHIEQEHWIVDIGAAKLADTPEAFDVIVLPNLYGDILSDVAAQITGSVGLAGSANIGVNSAMFEAIHGSAPKRANQNVANPTGLILASVMMLSYLNENETATLIHNALLRTLEEGIHTQDIAKGTLTKKIVGTKEFGEAVATYLGKKPTRLKEVLYKKTIKHEEKTLKEKQKEQKEIIGVDVFIEWNGSLDELSQKLNKLKYPLTKIYNRGVEVYPRFMKETLLTDSFRCRFLKESFMSYEEIEHLLHFLRDLKLEYTQIQTLARFDGHPFFSE